jgi:hypothetical protein
LCRPNIFFFCKGNDFDNDDDDDDNNNNNNNIFFCFSNGRYIDCLSLTCATNKGKMLNLHYNYKREETFKVNIRMIIKIIRVVVHAVYNTLNQDIRTKLNENLTFTLHNF